MMVEKEVTRKKIIFIFLVMLTAIIILPGTVALLKTRSESAVNKFKGLEYVNVVITEPNGSEYSLDSVGDILSDTNGKGKEIRFTNTTPNTVAEYVRTTFVFNISSIDDKSLVLPYEVEYELKDFDSTTWKQIGDKYYYKALLKPGEDTTNLCSSIFIKSIKTSDGIKENKALDGKNILNEYLKSKGLIININIVVDSVGISDNGDAFENAKKAWNIDNLD